MSMRRIILVLMISVLLILGSSLAQIEWTWFFSDPTYSWGTIDIISELPSEHIWFDDWQKMTGVDNGVVVSSWLTHYWIDSSLLSGDIDFRTMDFRMMDETYSGTIPKLIISEVYYDGTDERVEITNIGDDNFQGNLILSGVKSTLVPLTDVSLLPWASKIFGDTLAQVSGTLFIGKTWLSLNIIDTMPITAYLFFSGQLFDSFIVDQNQVNVYNDKKTSFEKIGTIIVPVVSERVRNALSGYIINPGVLFQEDYTNPSSWLSWYFWSLSHLIISEVYYDGTDEWFEITNIGDGDFQWNLTISGVKSTPLLLSNIAIWSEQSKIFGDIIGQISWNVWIEKTGLSLNFIDTDAINIQLLLSGQVEDNFMVDPYRVNKYNDKKTAFEKIDGMPTRVTSDRTVNALSWYIINPGIYFRTGMNITNVSLSPSQLWNNLQPPISCDFVVQGDLIKINEIFAWNEKYPPYVELAIHDNISLDSLSISGDLLKTGIEFLQNSSGITLEKNSLLLLASTGFWQNENISGFRNSDFSLLTTWHWLLITIGSWQNRQVIDISYLSGNTLGKSLYFWSKSQQCINVFDVLDDFSPWFERKFLKYLPVSTIVKIEYVQANMTDQLATGNIQTSWQVLVMTWNKLITTWDSLSLDNYTIHIVNIDYDPPWSDTNNEKITLLATNKDGHTTPVFISSLFRLKINGRNKTLSGILEMGIPTTFVKTFWFPNSTDSGQDVIVQLVYGDHIFDTYTYNPKKVFSQEETVLMSSWYSVSSVIDWDTFRIKYQGKTQSVRLLGMDAPENSKTRYGYIQCFGQQAKDYLKSLIDKKKVSIQFDPTQDQKDLYGRLLAYVFLDDELINQTMIEDGYAKEYTYKTAYTYQSLFKQAEKEAQGQGAGLWNENTCWASFSGLHLSGDNEVTGIILDISWLQFTITYVLPNPKWSDKAEELWLLIDATWDMTGDDFTSIDLSQGFILHVGSSKKKINAIVDIGQENILSWSLWLVNKAACVSLFYDEQELTKFCYPKPKEWQKFYASDTWLAETPQEDLSIINMLQLKRIVNQLCIRYKWQSFICKRIPASKAEIKNTQEQKLYKWFASLIKQYIINNWKSLYYDTSIKEYFDLVTQDKKLIAQWASKVDIYGQSILITDLKNQILVHQTTLPWIIAIFVGKELLY